MTDTYILLQGKENFIFHFPFSLMKEDMIQHREMFPDDESILNVMYRRLQVLTSSILFHLFDEMNFIHNLYPRNYFLLENNDFIKEINVKKEEKHVIPILYSDIGKLSFISNVSFFTDTFEFIPISSDVEIEKEYHISNQIDIFLQNNLSRLTS
jgi:hypothetical protein